MRQRQIHGCDKNFHDKRHDKNNDKPCKNYHSKKMQENLFKDSEIENFVIFRHGKAQRPFDADDDFSRNLVERGIKDAKEQAQRLLEIGFTPEIALVSSANRAFQTWQAAKEIFPNSQEIITRDLYLASPNIYWQHVINAKLKNVILIAHDPGLHDLCRFFLKGNDETIDAHYLAADLPTAGIAWFRRDKNIKSGMKLISHLRPIKTAD